MRHLLQYFFYFSFPLAGLAPICIFTLQRHRGLEAFPYEFYIFTFFLVFTLYNLDRWKDRASVDVLNVPLRAIYYQEHEKLFFVHITLSFTILASGLFFLPFFFVKKLIISSILTLLYFLLSKAFFIPSLIRGFLKPLLLGLAWGLVLSFFPYFYLGKNPDSGGILFFLSRFLIFFINGLWFDYRDKEGDKVYNKPNLSLYISESKLGNLLLVSSLLGILIHLSAKLFSAEILILGLYFLIAVLFKIKPFRVLFKKEIFYDLFLDFPIFLFPFLEMLYILFLL
ncbi:MAG: hypothetical protein H7A25_26005 [Leptospiraceae bacterium]|nr:hypothetical protein [Leptospiraceae bacterium]MCP5503380.1 hypothetical protein [Leptospiraceae bacterium]